MHRKFITLIVVTAIAVTGFSAPARAGNRDVANALAGLAAIAIIGAAIHKNRDHDRRRDPVVSRNNNRPAYNGGNTHRQKKHRRQGHVQPRPLPHHVKRTILPRSCIRAVNTRFGEETRLFGRHCLNNKYNYVSSLPQACAQRGWTSRGERRGYNVHCLKQKGYRISRR